MQQILNFSLLSNFYITYTVLAPVFAHPVSSRIRIVHGKIIGKVKMETTVMWGLTLIILKDIKYFQIWAYFKGIGINFNFKNFQNKIFPLFILRTIQSMHARYHRIWVVSSRILFAPWVVSPLFLLAPGRFTLIY